MRKLPGALWGVAFLAALAGLPGCPAPGSEVFPLGEKNLLPPELFDDNLHVAVGAAETSPIEQPILFTHTRHVKVLGMDCEYCHSGARKGLNAGVPATEVCMGCHTLVSTEGRPELVKLKDEYWKDGAADPIPWVKVHDLPDYVYFSHKRHVNGGVNCQECHGPMEELDDAQRSTPLKMGWCLDCHAEHPAVDTNYGDQAELRRAELKDCYTCHK